MTKKQARIPANLQPWIDARRKFRLSHEHVQMARELGMNPRKLGKLNNHDQEPWKLPLPEFLAKIYYKRFGKARPDAVRSIEETAAAKQAKELAKKATREHDSCGVAALRSAVQCATLIAPYSRWSGAIWSSPSMNFTHSNFKRGQNLDGVRASDHRDSYI
jgi:hypothetical protein